MEESKKILKGAADLFMRIGIKSVSMDDLARELGVSKKTIYKHFEDKKCLIGRVIQEDIEQDMKACQSLYSNTTENAVQKMINISRHVSHQHQDLNPAVIYDLQKYYPSEWNMMETFQKQFIQSAIVQNVEEGKSEGLYREDLDAQMISSMYVTLMQGMMQQLVSKDNTYDFKTLHLNMVSYHLYGICTKTGTQYLQQHINEITNHK